MPEKFLKIKPFEPKKIDGASLFFLRPFSGFKMSVSGVLKNPTDNTGISTIRFSWFPLQVSRLAPLASNELDNAPFDGL